MLRNKIDFSSDMYSFSNVIEEKQEMSVNPVDYTCFSDYISQTRKLLYSIFENTSTLADDQQ